MLDLAVARVMIVGMQLSQILPMDPQRRFLRELAALPDAVYDPLPVLHILVSPLGWTYRPGPEVLDAILWVVVVTGVTSLIGLFTNVSLVLFAWGNVFLQSFKYAFGDIHHPEAPMMIALVLLALSPAGRALSVDAWRARRRQASGTAEGDAHTLRTSRFARWPLLTIGWVLALAYFSAAFHKLTDGGFDWMNGYTLQYYMLQDAMRWDVPMGVWLGQQFGLVVVLSWLTILWEATFFLVLIFPALAWIYVPMGIGFHTGTWVTMRAGFFTFIALYSALISWSAGYRWWRERRGKDPQSIASAT